MPTLPLRFQNWMVGLVRSRAGVSEPPLRAELFSIVFCDEFVGPLSPFEFLKALRMDLTTRDVTIPIVLVSAGASATSVTAARDAGMNDVIAKPVSIATIERKLRSLLLAPRPFVTVKGFVGPDRRGSCPERRQFGERRPFIEDRRGETANGSVFVVPPRVNPDGPTKV